MTFSFVLFYVAIAAMIGGLVGTIASVFYTLPAGLKGKRGREIFDAMPRGLRRWLRVCHITVLGLLALLFILSFFSK